MKKILQLIIYFILNCIVIVTFFIKKFFNIFDKSKYYLDKYIFYTEYSIICGTVLSKKLTYKQIIKNIRLLEYFNYLENCFFISILFIFPKLFSNVFILYSISKLNKIFNHVDQSNNKLFLIFPLIDSRVILMIFSLYFMSHGNFVYLIVPSQLFNELGKYRKSNIVFKKNIEFFENEIEFKLSHFLRIKNNIKENEGRLIFVNERDKKNVLNLFKNFSETKNNVMILPLISFNKDYDSVKLNFLDATIKLPVNPIKIIKILNNYTSSYKIFCYSDFNLFKFNDIKINRIENLDVNNIHNVYQDFIDYYTEVIIKYPYKFLPFKFKKMWDNLNYNNYLPAKEIQKIKFKNNIIYLLKNGKIISKKNNL